MRGEMLRSGGWQAKEWGIGWEVKELMNVEIKWRYEGMKGWMAERMRFKRIIWWGLSSKGHLLTKCRIFKVLKGWLCTLHQHLVCSVCAAINNVFCGCHMLIWHCFISFWLEESPAAAAAPLKPFLASDKKCMKERVSRHKSAWKNSNNSGKTHKERELKSDSRAERCKQEKIQFWNSLQQTENWKAPK